MAKGTHERPHPVPPCQCTAVRHLGNRNNNVLQTWSLCIYTTLTDAVPNIDVMFSDALASLALMIVTGSRLTDQNWRLAISNVLQFSHHLSRIFSSGNNFSCHCDQSNQWLSVWLVTLVSLVTQVIKISVAKCHMFYTEQNLQTKFYPK